MKKIDIQREWYNRGFRDGRQQVVEGILNAMGLDYYSFEFAPVENWYDGEKIKNKREGEGDE